VVFQQTVPLRTEHNCFWCAESGVLMGARGPNDFIMRRNQFSAVARKTK
jgi:hypothetical protein